MGKKEDQHRWYLKNRKTHMANVRRRKRALRDANVARKNEYLRSHPCVDCGETDIDMLTFDHVRGKKRWDIAKMLGGGYEWKSIKEEIAKCEVRCWNHHMKRTKILRAASSIGRAFDS